MSKDGNFGLFTLGSGLPMDAPPPAPGSPSRTLTGRLKLGDWPEQLAPALTCHLRGTRFESFQTGAAAFH